MPDILLLKNSDKEKIESIKSRLHYEGIGQTESAILYNPARFKSLHSLQSNVQCVDLQDATTKKVIRVVQPLLSSSQSHILKELHSHADVEIVSAANNFAALNQLLKPRGFVSEKDNEIMVKGSDDVVPISDAKIPLTRIELSPPKKAEKSSFLQNVISYFKKFVTALSIKLLIQLLLRFI